VTVTRNGESAQPLGLKRLDAFLGRPGDVDLGLASQAVDQHGEQPD